MQIIKLWLKLTALLAILGWATHALNPEFAAWMDGFFETKKVIDSAERRAPAPEAKTQQDEAPAKDQPEQAYKVND